MSGHSARMAAGAATALAGLLAAAAAYVLVGGLPGTLYAAGIALAAVVGAVALQAGRQREHEPSATEASLTRWWGRKSRLIAELELDLAARGAELEEHRRALANLGSQLTRETETARLAQLQLERRIQELEVERDGLQRLVADEREHFEQTLEELGGGIGQHGNELAELERELSALISR